jgi:phosphatidylserine decarboxylase
LEENVLSAVGFGYAATSSMLSARTFREGMPAILLLAGISIATLVLWPWAAIVPLALLAFVIAFFRDPDPRVPSDPDAIVSPAHGLVVDVVNCAEPHYLKTDTTRVAIFLSVFDVHVQNAPIDGTIKFEHYQPGQFLDVRHADAPAVNEYRVIGIESPDGFRVAVRQMAGLIARRIVSWGGTGATFKRGDRFGMIRFGSRVELFLPVGTEVLVKPGQRVTGGETILARKPRS